VLAGPGDGSVGAQIVKPLQDARARVVVVRLAPVGSGIILNLFDRFQPALGALNRDCSRMLGRAGCRSRPFGSVSLLPRLSAPARNERTCMNPRGI
jgi:hypothetical protein